MTKKKLKPKEKWRFVGNDDFGKHYQMIHYVLGYVVGVNKYDEKVWFWYIDVIKQEVDDGIGFEMELVDCWDDDANDLILTRFDAMVRAERAWKKHIKELRRKTLEFENDRGR